MQRVRHREIIIKMQKWGALDFPMHNHIYCVQRIRAASTVLACARAVDSLKSMPKEVVFKVAMTCGGCSGAVTRILGKIEGVEGVNADVESKLVKVACADEVADDTLLQALLTWSKSSGKAVELVK